MRLTMQNIAKAKGEIKAIAEACTGTPTAKLIAVLIAAGITKTTDIAAILAISDRAVRKAKAELQDRSHSSASGTTGPAEPQDRGNYSSENGTTVPKTEPQDRSCSSGEPRARTRVKTTRPTNELPSEVVISKKEDSPSSVPPIDRKPPGRGKRLAADWQLPDDWREWTQINFAHASPAMITGEAEKFRDYWTAKAGHTASKLDWQATWRNWCRTAFAAVPSRQPVNNGRMSWDEQRARRLEETRALMAQFGGSTVQ